MTDVYCLQKIKKKLGFPYTIIEKSDEDILQDIIYDEALKTFSKYFPLEELIRREDCEKDPNYEAVWNFPTNFQNRVISVKKVIDVNSEWDFKLVTNNSIRIFGSETTTNQAYITIIAKTLHKKDLSTIPINQEDIFIEYCTILLAEELLPIKKEFTRLGSPIGDIELNTEILQNIVDKKVEFMEKKFYNSAKLSKRIPIVFNAPFANS